MADDIFEKIWSQLGRIYSAVRSTDFPVKYIDGITPDSFGVQDTGRLSDTAAMDLREEADAMRAEQTDNEVREPRRATTERRDAEAPPVIESQSTIGAEIREAVSEIGPAITGAISGIGQSSGGAASGDGIKGTQLTEHEQRVEALLDRIADGIEKLVAAQGAQAQATQQVIQETKSAGEKAAGLLGYAKQAIEYLAILVQLGTTSGGVAGAVVDVRKAGREVPMSRESQFK